MHVTEEQLVAGKVSIWAIPAREYADGGHIYTGNWDIRLYTNDPYQTGAVKVDTQSVELLCPGGIDLCQAAIKTLEEKKEAEAAAHYASMRNLDEQIRGLRQLTFQASPDTEDVIEPLEGDAILIDLNSVEDIESTDDDDAGAAPADDSGDLPL